MPPRGAIIEDANVVLQAAMDGQGAAPGVLPFIESGIATGRLRPLFEPPRPATRAYHLVRTPSSRRDAIIDSVWQWLLQEADASGSGTAEGGRALSLMTTSTPQDG